MILKELKSIIAQFQIPGEFDSVEELISGNINKTYKSTFRNGASRPQYIHQKINQVVFHHPVELMENMTIVTEHILLKLRQEQQTSSLPRIWRRAG